MPNSHARSLPLAASNLSKRSSATRKFGNYAAGGCRSDSPRRVCGDRRGMPVDPGRHNGGIVRHDELRFDHHTHSCPLDGTVYIFQVNKPSRSACQVMPQSAHSELVGAPDLG
jgi:hypothetical protein